MHVCVFEHNLTTGMSACIMICCLIPPVRRGIILACDDARRVCLNICDYGGTQQQQLVCLFEHNLTTGVSASCYGDRYAYVV